MAAETIVVNTGPLTTLARIDALEVAGSLPYEFVCPREVRTELDAGQAAGHVEVRPAWLSVLDLAAPLHPALVAGPDMGEAAVIQLALERGARLVCIDEWKARRAAAAAAAGLQVTGTPSCTETRPPAWRAALRCPVTSSPSPRIRALAPA